MEAIIDFIINSIVDGSLDTFILSTVRENIVSGLVIWYVLNRLAKDTDWAPNNQIMEMVMGLVSKKKREKLKPIKQLDTKSK